MDTNAKAKVILDTDVSAPFSSFLLPQQHCQPNPLFQQQLYPAALVPLIQGRQFLWVHQ
nr:MAG TPA: hypothetical protein [Caudoviricetes sp.]